MAFLSALALPMEGVPAAAGMLLPYVTSVHQEVQDNWLDGGGEFPEEAFTLLRDCRTFDSAEACDDTMILASEDAEGAAHPQPRYHGITSFLCLVQNSTLVFFSAQKQTFSVCACALSSSICAFVPPESGVSTSQAIVECYCRGEQSSA
jgi:hypothetical protein